MGYWEESLRFAQINGIEFDLKSRRIVGGHDVGRQRYMGRRGQNTEPTGGLPLSIEITIEMFGATLYPIKYRDLIDVLTDEEIGGQVDYVDPLFGPLPMQVINWQGIEQALRRDGAELTLSLEERSTDDLGLTVPISVPRGSSQAIASGRAVDMALPSLGVVDETIAFAFAAAGYALSGQELSIPVGGLFAGLAQQSINAIENSTPTVDFVRADVDRWRARVGAMLALDALRSVSAFSERAELILMLDAIQRSAYAAVTLLGTPATYQISGPILTGYSVAKRVYGDPSRWQDIVGGNGSIRNPLLLGRGTPEPIRVYLPKRRSLIGAG